MHKIFFLLLLLSSPAHSQTKNTDNESCKEINYSSIISNYPLIKTIAISNQQLQKSRYTNYHPERNLNNYYFELKEFTKKEKATFSYNNKEKCRLFYYGLMKFENFNIVVTLLNDTTATGINDVYIAQSINRDGFVISTLKLGEIKSPLVEKSLELTSTQNGNKITLNELYEEYETPVDEEPTVKREKTDKVFFNKDGKLITVANSGS